MSGADAMLHSADAGSAWTLLYPILSVVVPNPNVISAQIVLGLPDDAPRLTNYVDTWIAPNKSDWTLDGLYNYWIFDKGADEQKSRWPVIQDAFGSEQD